MTIAKDQFFVDFQRLTMFRGSPEEMKSFTTPNSEWEPTGKCFSDKHGEMGDGEVPNNWTSWDLTKNDKESRTNTEEVNCT